MPSYGYNRLTGQVISDFDHVVQSIGVIFTTRLGERVMRRHFGATAPILLGRLLTAENILRFFTLIAVALELWEPRFRITRVVPRASAEEARLGHMSFTVEGAYRPRGHLGDFTEEGPRRSIAINVANNTVSALAIS